MIWYDRRAMFEYIAEHWFLLSAAACLGVSSSVLLGRLNVVRIDRLREKWRVEELERIEQINKSIGGRDG